MEPRIASLEAIAESTGKTLEELRRRVDEGFRELRCEMRAEFNSRLNELRTELRSEIRDVREESNERYTELRETIRWLIGIQITTLLAVVGLLARAADLF